MNNKGFAITGILYSILVLFIVITALLLFGLQNKKTILDKLKLDTVDSIEKEVKVVRNQEEEIYLAYLFGDVVTLNDDTEWIVLKDSLTKQSTVRVMSKLNIKNQSNLGNNTGTNMFTSNSSEFSVAFDSTNSNNWNRPASLKTYLNGTVKTALENSLSTTINSIGMWGKNDLQNLGCNITMSGISASTIDCGSSAYSTILNSSKSWINLSKAESNENVFYINTNGNISNTGSNGNSGGGIGVRPVITISKDNIKSV